MQRSGGIDTVSKIRQQIAAYKGYDPVLVHSVEGEGSALILLRDDDGRKSASASDPVELVLLRN